MLKSEILKNTETVRALKIARSKSQVEVFNVKQTIIFFLLAIISYSFVSVLESKEGSFWFAVLALNGCITHVAGTWFKTVGDTAVLSKIWVLLSLIGAVVGIMGLAHYSF